MKCYVDRHEYMLFPGPDFSYLEKMGQDMGQDMTRSQQKQVYKIPGSPDTARYLTLVDEGAEDEASPVFPCSKQREFWNAPQE